LLWRPLRNSTWASIVTLDNSARCGANSNAI
jgi:hypothetical protein